ncbi:AI-2E family transporter [uncultured Rhodoblastus sp.]|uniref:AI-2E family transporter n=1 Tax=uncultured Rhodoblastus sp. TaxID=543037 RepID=UPI0025FBEC08|nr:AI-2E family transporter [uncultured Rhodoblastus sp.]
MTQPDDNTPAEPMAEQPSDMPLPSDPQAIFLGGIFVLAMLTAAYVARDIVLPMVFAIALKLLLQPGMDLLERIYIPKPLAALAIIFALLGAIVALGAAISGPAGAWVARLPEGVARLHERLGFLWQPVDALLQFVHRLENIGATGAPREATGPLAASAILSTLFKGAQSFADGLFTTLLFLYFLLLSGDSFLRRLVEILPHFRAKRQAIDISQQIEHDISAYLVTITAMNAIVGLATALVMHLTGVGDPMLWGTFAFLMNFAPIIGPALCMFVFLLAGLLNLDGFWSALAPAGFYLLIHLAEGETFTPMLLARRFTLNPVLVIVSFVFWFWMWGVPGAILSVPMLAILKIVCDRLRPFAALGHFLSG